MSSEKLHDGFRWRSHEITRIEGFSDAVFAFAITLLVISLEVPRTFAELAEAMHGFVAFALSFSLLFYLWYTQYKFFRRFGLQDGLTLVLNAVLLFVVLFYIYPLKFLFGYLVNIVSGGGGMAHLPNGRIEPMLTGDEPRTMMLFYSSGYVAVFVIFLLLYRHAWKLRGELKLTPSEQFDTRATMTEFLINIGVGCLSLLIAFFGGAAASGISGMIYFLLGILQTVAGVHYGRKRRLLSPSWHASKS